MSNGRIISMDMGGKAEDEAMKARRKSIEVWMLTTFQGQKMVLLLNVPPSVARRPERFWQPITGGVRAGETAEEACLREIKEETGVEVQLNELTKWPHSFELELADTHLSKTLFLAELDHPPPRVQINPEKHDAYQWVAIEQCPEWLFWPSNHATWAEVVTKLSEEQDKSHGTRLVSRQLPYRVSLAEITGTCVCNEFRY
jgi:dATP pyrophosphohydrolase